jgi:hypothetical protein
MATNGYADLPQKWVSGNPHSAKSSKNCSRIEVATVRPGAAARRVTSRTSRPYREVSPVSVTRNMPRRTLITSPPPGGSAPSGVLAVCFGSCSGELIAAVRASRSRVRRAVCCGASAPASWRICGRFSADLAAKSGHRARLRETESTSELRFCEVRRQGFEPRTR